MPTPTSPGKRESRHDSPHPQLTALRSEVCTRQARRKKDTYDPSVTIAAYLNGTTLFALIPQDTITPFPVALQLDLLLCHPTKCVPARLDLTYGETNLDSATLPSANEQPWWDEFRELARHEINPPVKAIEASPESTQPPIINWQFSPTYLQPGLEVGNLLSAMLMGTTRRSHSQHHAVCPSCGQSQTVSVARYNKCKQRQAILCGISRAQYLFRVRRIELFPVARHCARSNRQSLGSALSIPLARDCHSRDHGAHSASACSDCFICLSLISSSAQDTQTRANRPFLQVC